MALTKNCITEKIKEDLGFKKNKSFELTETLLEIIKSTLETGEDILVNGFGKFCVQHRGERKGQNPATGRDMVLPARRIVRFKCSNRLRAKINGKR
jgi:integration host factor subunit alpha